MMQLNSVSLSQIPLLNTFTDVSYQADYIMPFSAYVRHLPSHRDSASAFSNQSQFPNLPFDVRQLIYKQCDLATNFALMRTSSVLCDDALVAFWGHSAPWYQADSNWLIFEYGYLGAALHCTDFARCVQQVEVTCIGIESDFYHEAGRTEDPSVRRYGRSLNGLKKTLLELQDQAEELWDAFSNNFPAAKVVVLTDSFARNPERPIPEEFAIIAKSCPQAVQLRISIKQSQGDRLTKGAYTNLYRPIREQGRALSWALITKNWKRDRIMLPKKTFRGPVGAFNEILWQRKLLHNQDDAVRFLRLQSCEAFLFHKSRPFLFSVQAAQYPLKRRESGLGMQSLLGMMCVVDWEMFKKDNLTITC